MNEEIKMFEDEEIIDGKEIWYETEDPDFIQLSLESHIVPRWLAYEPVLEQGYGPMPVKPINNYVSNIGLRPELADIDGQQVTLRFVLYADMYLLVAPDDPHEDYGLYNVDRPWMRQYYRTSFEMPEREDCFKPTYKFFVPWFVDKSQEVEYVNSPGSNFVIHEMKDFWYTPSEQTEFVTPHMVPFQFKNVGKHMVSEKLGIPRRGDPIFDMVFLADDILVERIKEQYANN